MYMVRHTWNCERHKIPECLEDIKAANREFASEGNGSGKIYVDFATCLVPKREDRMDVIVWELEVESLDEYFTGQRADYAGLTPDTGNPIERFNSRLVGTREIFEVIV